MNLIAMVDLEWGIGKDGKQPIFIKEDLARFKARTTGKTVIMGRKTLEALPGGRPLADRRNIILTHDKGFKVDGAEVVHSIEEVLAIAPEDAFVIGGESVYRQLLPYCNKAYITTVFRKFAADRFCPNLDKDKEWQLARLGCVRGDDIRANGIAFCWDEYERR